MAITQGQLNTHNTETGQYATASAAAVTARAELEAAKEAIRDAFTGPASGVAGGNEYIVYRDTNGQIMVVASVRIA